MIQANTFVLLCIFGPVLAARGWSQMRTTVTTRTGHMKRHGEPWLYTDRDPLRIVRSGWFLLLLRLSQGACEQPITEAHLHLGVHRWVTCFLQDDKLPACQP